MTFSTALEDRSISNPYLRTFDELRETAGMQTYHQFRPPAHFVRPGKRYSMAKQSSTDRLGFRIWTLLEHYTLLCGSVIYDIGF